MKLTQVCKILEINPIPDADRIEKVRVLGWDCVVQKGLHNVGDLVLFIFPDTLVPKKFLDSTYEGDEKVRLKTIKMRGQFSAGLILPMMEVKKTLGWDTLYPSEGDDLAELLGIEKYEKPMPAQLAGSINGHFPRHIIEKTDEDNYRSNPDALTELRNLGDEPLVATIKADGSSGTFLVDPSDGVFKVCSRNYELKKDVTNSFWKVAEQFKIEGAIRESGKNLAIQGELVGEGVQGNPMGFKGLNLLVFLIKDLDTGRWFSWDETVDFCLKNRINVVDEVLCVKASELPDSDQLQEMANKLKYNNGRPAEGMVIRPMKPIPSLVLGKFWLSLKVISQPYDQKN